MTVLMFLDGVLRKENQSPIYEAVSLYQSLNQTHRVLILCHKRGEAERWLKQNNIVSIVDDLVDYIDPASTPDDESIRQVEHCRAKGKIDFVVTSDLDLTKQLMENGITTLLFVHPKYMRPEFRPDKPYGIRAWDSITEEIDRQQELYAEDPRV